MSSNTSSRVALAETLTPRGIEGVALSLLLIVAGSAVLAISAKVQVPFWPVPLTLQTLAVAAIAATYGSRLAVLTVLAYLAQGMAGWYVFANTPPAVPDRPISSVRPAAF